jgi:glutathione S-transferase
LQEWLTYIATEIHKSFGLLWNKSMGDVAHGVAREGLEKKFDFLARNLEGKQFLFGDRFTVADAYLFTVLNWNVATPVDLKKWPAVETYYNRLKQRPSIERALKEEQTLYREEMKRHKAA